MPSEIPVSTCDRLPPNRRASERPSSSADIAQRPISMAALAIRWPRTPVSRKSLTTFGPSNERPTTRGASQSRIASQEVSIVSGE